MRIRCNICNSVCLITKRHTITPQFTRLYCVCKNASCGHTFATSLSFEYTISPSALDLPEAMRQGLKAGYPLLALCQNAH